MIMLATKSEMRDVRCNPGQVLIVLVYKDMLPPSNDITSLPSVISHLLQGYKVVFPNEILKDRSGKPERGGVNWSR
jgi:hypothetical protein